MLDQSGLRPGVIISLLLLCAPLFIFVGQCSRVGAPARDRRLAMLRMAGATPGETAKVVAVETGLASGVGSASAAAIFLVGRKFVDTVHIATDSVITKIDETTTQESTVTQGFRWLPTDVALPIWVIVLLIAVVPVLATVASVLALRKVLISPFGVTRTVPTQPPTALPAALFLIGTIGLAVWSIVERALGIATSGLALRTGVAFALFLMCVIGLLMGSASLAASVGRLVASRTNQPSLLIASRRMIAAPYTSSRATASVLLAVLIGSTIQGVRANFLIGTDPTDTFYADTFTLLNGVLIVAIALSAASLLVTSSEAIVERRRTLAALAAAGTPRRTLVRSVLAETLVPIVPSIALASIAGVLAARGLIGTRTSKFDPVTGNGADVAVPIPWERVLVLGVAATAVCVALTALSLLFLRRSTSLTELRTAA